MGRTRVAFSIWLSEGEGTPVKGKKKPGMDVPLFMKIRISLSLVLTLGVAYIALACEEGGERWKLLPDPQSPIWVGTLMALIVAGLGLLVWERALNARFAAVAVLTLGIFYIAFALDGGFGLPALPRGEDRRLWEGAMCALTYACSALLVWQKREEPPALDALPPNTYIVTSRATPVRPGPGREFKCGDLYALRGDLLNGVRTAGWRPVLLEGEVLWISGKDCRKIEAAPSRAVQVTVECAQLYKGPGKDFPPAAAVPRDAKLEVPNAAGWRPVLVEGTVYWVSREATRRYDGGKE